MIIDFFLTYFLLEASAKYSRGIWQIAWLIFKRKKVNSSIMWYYYAGIMTVLYLYDLLTVLIQV